MGFVRPRGRSEMVSRPLAYRFCMEKRVTGSATAVRAIKVMDVFINIFFFIIKIY